jgi:hypothetical protein
MTLSLVLAALGAAGAGPAATTVAYQVDASLVQIDKFGRPSAIEPRFAAVTEPRTLGLGRLRVGLDLQTGEGGSLTLVLRPDAANRVTETDKEPARELDTRAGDSYRPMPTLRLLDAYQLHLTPGRSLELSAGVWEELVRTQASYPQLLAFGLAVQLPAKFSGARLRWHRRSETASDLALDLYVFQGDEDRAAATSAGAHQLDEAPVARDPHQAAALAFEWAPDKALSLGAVVGFGDSAELGGKRSEQFAQLTARWASMVAGRELALVLDARHAAEQWRADVLRVAPRVQQSLSLTSALNVVPRHWALLGAHLGTSQHAKHELALDELRTYSGWQLETGYHAELDQGLSLTILIDEERRRVTIPGIGEKGGFADGTDDRTTVRRVGLQLDYVLNGNA